MTRRRRTTRVAMAAALSGACAHHPAPAARPPLVGLPPAYDARALPFPPGGALARDFAICPPGLIVVPVQGGLYLAGWNDWLRKPGKRVVSSVDCDARSNVFYLRGGELSRRGADGKATAIGTLPAGDFHVVASVDGAAWVWGTSAKGVSVVYRYEAASGLRQVAAVKAPIGAAAAAGTTALVTAMGPRLVLWQRDAGPTVLATLPDAPDGLALQPNGDLWVSVPKGILSVTAKGAVSVFAIGLHGPLRAQGRSLFVLEAAESQVVRLRPSAAKPTTTKPAPRASR